MGAEPPVMLRRFCPKTQARRQRKAIMASGQELRRRLFDLYAANLSALRQREKDFPRVPEDTFVCPLCRRAFGRDALLSPEKLSIEDCIPKALGGTRATSTLTCKDCNNGMGSVYDAHLKTRFEAEEFLAGLSEKPVRAWLKAGEERVRADFKIKRGERPSVNVLLDRENSHRRSFDATVRALNAEHANPQGLKMQVQFSLRYKRRNARIALLRIGFLMMFRHFGYSYTLNSNLAQVLKQILNPTENIIPEAVALEFPQEPVHVNTVAVLTSPPELRAFMAIVKLRTDNRTLYKGVLMPGLDSEGPTLYERHYAARQADQRFRGRYTVIPYDAASLADPDAVLFPYELWAEVL